VFEGWSKQGIVVGVQEAFWDALGLVKSDLVLIAFLKSFELEEIGTEDVEMMNQIADLVLPPDLASLLLLEDCGSPLVVAQSHLGLK
jgi:hypothetical protein